MGPEGATRPSCKNTGNVFPADFAAGAEFPTTGIFFFQILPRIYVCFYPAKAWCFLENEVHQVPLNAGIFIWVNEIRVGFRMKNDNPLIAQILVEKYLLNMLDAQ